MERNEKRESYTTEILFPYEPTKFWEQIRTIIREEVGRSLKVQTNLPEYQTPGMTYKPLYKITEVCQMFQITRPTIYDWIKHGKLRPYKIRSRVYFLWKDLEKLIS